MTSIVKPMIEKSSLSSYPQMTLAESLMARHSSRSFLSTPVPKSIIKSALSLAQHAPSNSNVQPHRVFILSGEPLRNLKQKLVAAASKGSPNIPPLPKEFTHYRSELGAQVYGEGWGLARNDTAGRTAAVLHNYRFFGASVGAIVCIDRRLSGPDMVGVGAWLQSFLLALTERGVQSAVEVSVAGYPEVLRRECGIPDELDILCGVAIGYEDPSLKVNQLRVGKNPLEENIKFLE